MRRASLFPLGLVLCDTALTTDRDIVELNGNHEIWKRDPIEM
jgi:hypothetical protein